ncbi:hypothetical protein EYE40_02920 [Glaciihabitans arcticus]|uniref:HIRAN domain-containing protein n=1 Tax=Glaciihabitans arcticus TaxID=2668039 RepID=A0A4Q9GQX8_9MICO|nr:hypothetical protein [Glaciihabitans arcticus]TBN56434.1 hypothetical protein EYE40_02920 [Glaciihabitans arcticus]
MGFFGAGNAGSGSYNNYLYDLVPKNKRVRMTLAGSDEFQDEITRVEASGNHYEAFITKRTLDEERTDAPLAVRFFSESRMSSIVGFAPRGMEPIVLEALNRLEAAGKSTRIPAEIVKGRGGLRVELLLGLTR